MTAGCSGDHDSGGSRSRSTAATASVGAGGVAAADSEHWPNIYLIIIYHYPLS